mgnify:CR=1 FL=1
MGRAEIETAKRFAANGLSVIPIRANGSKAPLCKWQEFQRRIMTNSEIEDRFAPHCGIGIVCGAVSGNLECIDFDEQEVFENLKEKFKNTSVEQIITRLILTKTPHGYHLVYRAENQIDGNKKLACSETGASLIETRGEGGFFIAPGSPPECHPDKKTYDIISGSYDNIPLITAAERHMLLEACRTFNKQAIKLNEKIITEYEDAGRPGDIFNKTAKWEDILEPHGWIKMGVRDDGTEDWQRPAKDGPGISATVNYNGSNLLYVFSTNAKPFEPNRGYTKFTAYALLNHGGNFREAASALAREGVRGGLISIDDFVYVPSQNNFFYLRTGDFWVAEAIDGILPPVEIHGGAKKRIRASTYIKRNRYVNSYIWAPGEPKIIENKKFTDDGWIYSPGIRILNEYDAPHEIPGNPDEAGMWLDHVYKLYPEEAEHIISWLAFKIQNPGVKINHILFLGGGAGIGKDTLLEPVKRAVGLANYRVITPTELFGRFTSFVKCVILHISEIHDLGTEITRFSFYQRIKDLSSAPPTKLKCEEKYLKPYYIPNVCGVIMTTNHKSDGVYLSPDDRRHFIAWSNLTEDDLPADYFAKLYKWYESGGVGHVCAFLKTLDISKFSHTQPPPKTDAFWEIVSANEPMEIGALQDAIEALKNPIVFTAQDLMAVASTDLSEWLGNLRYRRSLFQYLDRLGYRPVRNKFSKQGLWKVNGKRYVIYGKVNVPQPELLQAIEEKLRSLKSYTINIAEDLLPDTM